MPQRLNIFKTSEIIVVFFLFLQVQLEPSQSIYSFELVSKLHCGYQPSSLFKYYPLLKRVKKDIKMIRDKSYEEVVSVYTFQCLKLK